MGVEFFSCSACEETYADCGYYFGCDCGQNYCSEDCGDKNVNDDGETTCKICRDEYQTDWVLLDFLLKKFSLTREEATRMCANQQKAKQKVK